MVIDLGILSIKLDVLVFQILNILLLLRIIRKLFGDTIVEQIAHFRKTKQEMLEADQALKKLAEQAQDMKEEIVNDGKKQKEEIIQHAHQVASHKEKEILEQAEHKAKNIIAQAQAKSQQMEEELKENYTHMVKTTAWSMVKKIFEKNPKAQETYVQTLVDEFQW